MKNSYLLALLISIQTFASGTGVNGPDTEGQEIPVKFNRVVLEKDLDKITNDCIREQIDRLCEEIAGASSDSCNKSIHDARTSPVYTETHDEESFTKNHGLFFNNASYSFYLSYRLLNERLHASHRIYFSISSGIGHYKFYSYSDDGAIPHFSYVRDLENLELDWGGNYIGDIGAKEIEVEKVSANKTYLYNKETRRKSKIFIDNTTFANGLTQGLSAL